MINKDFIPPPFKDWDWENKTDRHIPVTLSRGQLMSLCEAYCAPLSEAVAKRMIELDVTHQGVKPNGLPEALPSPTPAKDYDEQERYRMLPYPFRYFL